MQKAKIAIDNSLDYPEITEPILQWGYPRSEILKGRKLCATADELINVQANKYIDLAIMTNTLEKNIKAGRTIYIKHLKLARVVITPDKKEFYVPMGLKGRRHKNVFPSGPERQTLERLGIPFFKIETRYLQISQIFYLCFLNSAARHFPFLACPSFSLFFSFASKMLPYRGLGTGVQRALKEQPNIELIDDVDADRFIVRIPRPEKKK